MFGWGNGRKLTAVLSALNSIMERLDAMSAELDRLTTSVTKMTAVSTSVVALIGGLADEIRDNANNPAALNALADELDASEQKLAAAVTANTSQA